MKVNISYQVMEVSSSVFVHVNISLQMKQQKDLVWQLIEFLSFSMWSNMLPKFSFATQLSKVCY